MNIQAHPKAGLSATQVARLWKRLVSERQNLASSISSLHELITENSQSSIGAVARAERFDGIRDRAKVIAAHHWTELSEIDAALGRLDDGRYGVCETSGEPIPYNCLLINPSDRTGATKG